MYVQPNGIQMDEFNVTVSLGYDNPAKLSVQSFYDPSIFSCLLYTSPSPRDRQKSRMPSSA